MREFKYLGFWNCDSKCGVEIIKREDNPDSPVVVLTELPDNPGTSVTNMVEDIATMVYREFLSDYDPEKIVWIEHYPHEFYQKSFALRHKEGIGTYDLVKMKYIHKRGVYVQPDWIRLDVDSLKKYGISPKKVVLKEGI